MDTYNCKVCNNTFEVKRLKPYMSQVCRSCSKKGSLNPIKPGTKCRTNYEKFEETEIRKRKIAQTRSARGTRSHGINHNWKVIYKIIWDSPDECSYCKIPIDKFQKYSFQLDHKISPMRGGSGDSSNLCISCVKCNASKGLMTDKEWLVCLEDLRANNKW